MYDFEENWNDIENKMKIKKKSKSIKNINLSNKSNKIEYQPKLNYRYKNLIEEDEENSENFDDFLMRKLNELKTFLKNRNSPYFNENTNFKIKNEINGRESINSNTERNKNNFKKSFLSEENEQSDNGQNYKEHLLETFKKNEKYPKEEIIKKDDYFNNKIKIMFNSLHESYKHNSDLNNTEKKEKDEISLIFERIKGRKEIKKNPLNSQSEWTSKTSIKGIKEKIEQNNQLIGTLFKNKKNK